jgi:hypothetical protein
MRLGPLDRGSISTHIVVDAVELVFHCDCKYFSFMLHF